MTNIKCQQHVVQNGHLCPFDKRPQKDMQKYLGEQYEPIERDIKRAEVIKQIIEEK